METTNRNYNGTNKRSVIAFKAENGDAKFNIIPSASGKTYIDFATKQDTGIGMLFFSCGNQTGYVTMKAAKHIINAPDQVKATMDCLVVDHQTVDAKGNPTVLSCLEVDSPNAIVSI